jgi:hypothetical protein
LFPGASAQIPLLLLPLRIETRFADTARGAQLWLRIYPDQIAIDSHDPQLSIDEWSAALQYWTAMWPLKASDMAGQQAAWADLAAAFGPRRAAYVASLTQPADFQAWVTGPGTALLSTGRTLPTAPTTLRSGSWVKPAVARALPTQWLVVLYSGATTQVIQVQRPARDMVVSPDPGASMPLGSPGGPTDAMSWLSDFNQALAAGMAVTIPLSKEQRASGFDQVVVLGVSGDYGAQGQASLERLLTAQRFTQGLAFVPQGTPTRNSADSVSGYTRTDPGFVTSFAAERQGPLVPPGPVPQAALASAECPDGWMFAGLLGIDPALIAHTQHADGTDQEDSVAMLTASWSATGEYFLRYLMNVFNSGSTAPDPLRQFVTANLRARGPLPALRIGRKPYGILPIAALATVTQTHTAPVSFQVARYIQTARPIWESAVTAFPLQVTATQGTSPDQALMNVLARDATSVTISARLCTGPWFAWNLAQWHRLTALELTATNRAQADAERARGTAIQTALSQAQSLSAAQEKVLGWPSPAADGPLGGLMYLNPLAADLPHVTADGQVSETTFLPAGYALDESSVGQKVNVLTYTLALSATQLLTFVPEAADLTLLSAVLRQSLLLEYAKAAGQILGRTLSELEQGGGDGTLLWALRQTAYTPPAGLPPASGALGDYIHAQVLTAAGQGAFPTLYALRSAVQHLSTLSTAALDRVLTESLDVCGYRLDAWATAVATSLLLAQRAQAPTGIGLGAWGYVADLRPATRQTLSAADLATLAAALGKAPATSPVPPTRDTTGFVLAPSLTHAVTGAVLRNGYLSHAAGIYTPAFAVDLSSARVRQALYLLEGMRQGQSLGALLGYFFEQGLHASGLEALQQPFRLAYPIIANKMTQYSAAPTAAVAASNVVDGAALQQAWVAGTIGWGAGGLPASGSAQYQTVSPLLDQLSDRLDALNDVALAESVFQMARGNPARAGGVLHATSREQHPPEPQVVETPRSGLDLTQRILSCFAVTPASPPPSVWLGAQPATPRALAEPWLERWLGAILPAPGQVVFQLAYTSSSGTAVSTGLLNLSAMGLAALDLLALAPAPPTGAAAIDLDGSELAGSDLERWILCQCARSGALPPGASLPRLMYVPTPAPAAPDLTLPQLLMLARSAQELLGQARPVTPADFIAPSAQYPAADLDLTGAAGRLGTAFTALGALNTALAAAVAAMSNTALTPANGDTLSGYLLTCAAFGFSGAAPVTTARDSASLTTLLAQARQLATAVASRVTALTSDASLYAGGQLVLASLAAAPSTAPAGQRLQVAQDTAAAIFGARFIILPVVTPTTGGPVPDPVAVARGQIAAAAAAASPAQHLTVAGVLQQLTHVRAPVMRLDEMMSLAAVLTDAPVPDLLVAQLGPGASSPWLGAGPFNPAWPVGLPPHTLQGSYALLLWTPPALGPATGASMTGLFFDEWIEQIPSSVEKPAAAFHYAEPAARTPQSLLLAVAPPAQQSWSAQSLLNVVLEAVALAKIRCVDPQTLESGGRVGQLLPALFAGFGATTTTSSLIPRIPTMVRAAGT